MINHEQISPLIVVQRGWECFKFGYQTVVLVDSSQLIQVNSCTIGPFFGIFLSKGYKHLS